MNARSLLAALACGALFGGPSQAGPEPQTYTIRAGEAGPKINPFIYGQFIEHLGRCIYGGIWAEMLEDRKFYFPVTDEYRPYRSLVDTPFPVVGASPWQVMGGAGSVRMDRDRPFVGDQTPVVAAGSGLRQRDLGVVEGKEYVGHVWLRAPRGRASATVTLAWGDGEADRQTARVADIGPEYTRFPLSFRAGSSTDHAMLEIDVHGSDVYVGTASLMPGDNVRGMRADTLALLKQLGGTMYRWPGGNFVSGYDWHDGLGDRDRRPPRKNPAWTGVEHNDFGIDEFLDFCREIGTEPVVTVNTGFGDAYSASQEVEYCNGSPATAGGAMRVANGHERPYGVKYWCVGNEMWGHWQLGFMQLKQYTLKHDQVAGAMWKADPGLQLIGSGELGHGHQKYDPDEKRSWSRGMLEECADHMSLISEHFYHDRGKDLGDHVRLLAGSIREKAEAHRELQKELGIMPGRTVPIAMDEWNYWHKEYVYGDLGCVYDLADALGVAVGLHEYFRNTDVIQMAHYAQTVNVIGCIKTTKTRAYLDTTAYPLMLYRQRFGTVPVPVEASETSGVDVSAAWAEGRSAMTVGVVNPTREAIQIRLKFEGADLADAGEGWVVAGDDPAMTVSADRQPLKVVETPVRTSGPIDVPPLSISVFRLPRR